MDDADVRAREIASDGARINKVGVGEWGPLVESIATALREAERRGMMRGLEAAALYHDELAGVCETLGGDYTIDSAAHKDAALVHHRQAIEIRALKATDETD